MGRSLLVWFSLLMLCMTADMRADSTAGSMTARSPAASEVSDTEESKRFGYIPSRGRKSEEQIREETGATRSDNVMPFDEEAKRAFHGARGKKLAMVPMYPYNMEYQWKRSDFFPSRNVYTTNALMDQGPVPLAGNVAPVRFVFGRGRKEAAEDNDSAEQFFPETGINQHFSNQPFYSRLLGSNGPVNTWMGMPSKDDETVGKRMVYYTSRG